MSLINPENFPPEGTMSGRVYVLSDFPAVQGREIITQYVPTAMPKIGEYKANEQLMFKLMSFVGVRIDGRDEPLMLTTPELINNHVKDSEDLIRLEMAMMQKNCSFFRNGGASNFFGNIARKAEQLITKTLTDFSQQLKANASQQDKS